MPSPEKVTKETFRAELQRLVNKFAANEDEYTSPGYPEAQLRLDFLDPRFRALGWDVENRCRPENIEANDGCNLPSFTDVAARDSLYPCKRYAISLRCRERQV